MQEIIVALGLSCIDFILSHLYIYCKSYFLISCNHESYFLIRGLIEKWRFIVRQFGTLQRLLFKINILR